MMSRAAADGKHCRSGAGSVLARILSVRYAGVVFKALCTQRGSERIDTKGVFR